MAPARAVSAGIVIGAVLLTGALVSVMDQLARPGIARQSQARAWQRMVSSLPATLHGAEARPLSLPEAAPAWLLGVFSAGLAGRTEALVVHARSPGCYVDSVEFALAVAPSGRVLGMSILAHAETPGIGARVAGQGGAAWRARFQALLVADAGERRWALREAGGIIDALSGATVTSACLTQGSRRAAAWLNGSGWLAAADRQAPPP